MPAAFPFGNRRLAYAQEFGEVTLLHPAQKPRSPHCPHQAGDRGVMTVLRLHDPDVPESSEHPSWKGVWMLLVPRSAVTFEDAQNLHFLRKFDKEFRIAIKMVDLRRIAAGKT